jgi:hypothetical protein
LIDLLSAVRSKSGTRPPHEYIRDTLSLSYHECTLCGNRTKLVCIRCSYCYSCHWKKEEAEKKLLNAKLGEIFPSSLLSIRKNGLMKKREKMATPTTPAYLESIISRLVEECNNEEDIDKKIELLYKINSILPKLFQENLPSLITDDYIDTALYRIYQKLHGMFGFSPTQYLHSSSNHINLLI